MKIEYIGVRLPKRLKDIIQEKANANGQSMTKYMEELHPFRDYTFLFPETSNEYRDKVNLLETALSKIDPWDRVMSRPEEENKAAKSEYENAKSELFIFIQKTMAN